MQATCIILNVLVAMLGKVERKRQNNFHYLIETDMSKILSFQRVISTKNINVTFYIFFFYCYAITVYICFLTVNLQTPVCVSHISIRTGHLPMLVLTWLVTSASDGGM